jgi:hypothetical protein
MPAGVLISGHGLAHERLPVLSGWSSPTVGQRQGQSPRSIAFAFLREVVEQHALHGSKTGSLFPRQYPISPSLSTSASSQMARWEAAAKAPETSLANVAPLGSAIGALSISGEKPVLVYDDGRMTEAARVWFIL